MKAPDFFIGKRLQVGVGLPICLGLGPTEVRGSAHLEGPVLIGNPISFPIPNVSEANLMVSRCINIEALPPPPSIFKVSSRGLPPTPIDVMLGDPTGPVGVTAFCGPMPFIVQASTIDLITLNYNLLSAFTTRIGPSFDLGTKIFTGAKSEFGVDTNFSLAFNLAPLMNTSAPNFSWNPQSWAGPSVLSLQAEKKSFDIKHPTKENWRLRHVCLEGPSADVYYRGKLNNENIIELPDYWRNLVDLESITVSMTAIGVYQELFVEKIESGKVYVKNNASGPIKCHYIIHGERIDTEKNIPEYEGSTPDDYPGNNNSCSIAGWTYDRKWV